MSLQPYDLLICYQPGKSMEIAVALSEEKEAIQGMNVEVHVIYPQFSKDMLQRIRDKTAVDPEHNVLKKGTSWLALDHSASFSIPKPYWPFCDEFAVEVGIAMKGTAPSSPALQKEILTRPYSAHQGTENTKLRARTSV